MNLIKKGIYYGAIATIGGALVLHNELQATSYKINTKKQEFMKKLRNGKDIRKEKITFSNASELVKSVELSDGKRIEKYSVSEKIDLLQKMKTAVIKYDAEGLTSLGLSHKIEDGICKKEISLTYNETATPIDTVVKTR